MGQVCRYLDVVCIDQTRELHCLQEFADFLSSVRLIAVSVCPVASISDPDNEPSEINLTNICLLKSAYKHTESAAISTVHEYNGSSSGAGSMIT